MHRESNKMNMLFEGGEKCFLDDVKGYVSNQTLVNIQVSLVEATQILTKAKMDSLHDMPLFSKSMNTTAQ